MTFGENLKKLRVDANKSQEILGEILGVDQKTISNWEKDISEPSVTYIKKIVKYFDISYELLLDTE